MPRMKVDKSFTVSVAEQESFILRLHEAYKDIPDDQKPLITKMGLKTKVEMVECAFGTVPRGSPLSYQCPLPSSQDYMPCDNPPPQPPLPMFSHVLKPVSVHPTLSGKELGHLEAMHVTWEEAHNLEQFTRGCKESAEKLGKMRLTSHFREITKLRPGQSHAEHLLIKLKQQNPKSKTLDCQVVEGLKPEVLREYCQHLCINWSPCGLVVNPNTPWVEVMPDGVVYDPKETSSFGLVHTKYVDVKRFINCHFLSCETEVLQLRRNHPYYWHIQAEMMVTGMSWCDLLVYSGENILVQRIYRDEMIIKEMKHKLEEFFFYYYLPGLD